MNKKYLNLALVSALALGTITNVNALDNYIPRATIQHKVEKGDTLIKIAERYFNDGSLNDELSLYLGRAYPDYIYIGEVLEIPDKQVLLGNVAAPDRFGCTPVDLENPYDLNNKYYKMIKGDYFNGVYHMFYKEIFDANPGLENTLSNKELRLGLYIFNGIKDERNMQIGTKIYLASFDQLIGFTNNLKNTNKLIKTR